MRSSVLLSSDPPFNAAPARASRVKGEISWLSTSLSATGACPSWACRSPSVPRATPYPPKWEISSLRSPDVGQGGKRKKSSPEPFHATGVSSERAIGVGV